MMLERDGYPPGVPCWVDTGQPDPDAAVAFYGSLFGWEFEERTSTGSVPYFIGRLRGRDVAGVGGRSDRAQATSAWTTYVWVESADETSGKVDDAGGTTLVEPFDVPTAGRMAVFADPAGGIFGAWQAEGHRGAQLVNEPGTWNFSELNTVDPEGAKAFYGSVFGWELSELDVDGDGSGFFRMPGYGEFLASRDPDLYDRQERIGAPTGFEEAVAWLVPTEREGSDESQSHWSITFAVDDADAIAERAAELGGTVLVPPMDAPWIRMTVIRDPQGAVFTASKFTPPA
ncbi:MAG TPA: VOC family protein [Actinomycetota bacterium]|nr:VOC family protein [Actinomycetota bacterium]